MTQPVLEEREQAHGLLCDIPAEDSQYSLHGDRTNNDLNEALLALQIGQ